MLNNKLIDAEYPFLEDVIYVDSCQIGIPPLRTQCASRQFMSEYTQAIVTDGDAGFGEVRKKTRAQLAQLVGGSAEEIFYTKNTTEGTAILATGYPLGPGDNVVTCDLEHPSNLYPWINASKNRGFELRIAKTENGAAKVSDLIAQMDENTKVVTISVVQAGTGYYADLTTLSKACHACGAILAVDAIQAIGRLDINVKKQGIDYLACGGYKGLMAGFGVGFAWCASHLISKITPVYAGAFSATSFPVPPDIITNTESFELRRNSTRLETGTYNSFGICMMSTSLSLLLELGIENIQNHVLALEGQLRDQLEISDLEVVTPEDPHRRSGIIVAYYPKEFYEEVENALQSNKIRLTHRPGYLRLALSFNTSEAQVETIADVLSRIRLNKPKQTTA